MPGKSSKCSSQCQNFTYSSQNSCHLHNLSYPLPNIRFLSPKPKKQRLSLLCIHSTKSTFIHTPCSLLQTCRLFTYIRQVFTDHVSSHGHTKSAVHMTSLRFLSLRVFLLLTTMLVCLLMQHGSQTRGHASHG